MKLVVQCDQGYIQALLHREALDHMIVMLKLLDSFLGLQQLNVSIRFRHF